MGSLFAGIGGFDLGFERAGFETRWQVEIDPFCRKVLAKHFPNAERYEDVRTSGAANLGRVDVICGGFPCQDISQAGNRAGITGSRSGLWTDACRIISELRPRFALLENVGALLWPIRRPSLTEAVPIGTVLGDLSEIGYDAEWDVISAADMGLPHLRERVWIIAYPMQYGRYESGDNAKSPHHKERHDSSYGEVRENFTDSIRASRENGFSSDTSEERYMESRPEEYPSNGGVETFSEHIGSIETSLFADAREKRAEGFFQEEVSRLSGLSWCKDVRRVEDLRDRPDIPEPLFRGTCDGIPNWVDRVGSCGNAIVPQIAEIYARQLMKKLAAPHKAEPSL